MKTADSTNLTRLSKKLLKEINNINEKDDTLNILITILESANDPDPSELYLLESLYQLREKAKLVESRIQNHLIQKNKSLPGNKLNDLYNINTPFGSSKLFNY